MNLINMFTLTVNRFEYLMSIIPTLLEKIPDEEFRKKSTPEKWSKLEILGHLIDSAANNHQRFIRIQYEDNPIIFYDQNEWNRLNHYSAANKTELIRFWQLYNQRLLEVVKNIPEEKLSCTGTSRNGEQHTLEWYIQDYVQHMEHHLRQITDFEMTGRKKEKMQKYEQKSAEFRD